MQNRLVRSIVIAASLVGVAGILGACAVEVDDGYHRHHRHGYYYDSQPRYYYYSPNRNYYYERW